MAIPSLSVYSDSFDDGLLPSPSPQILFNDHIKRSHFHNFPQISALEPSYYFLNLPLTFPWFTSIYQHWASMLLNSFSFVCKDIPLVLQTRSMFLKAMPALPILIQISFRTSPSLRISHPRYTNFFTFWMISFSITTWLVSSDLIFISPVFRVFTFNLTLAASYPASRPSEDICHQRRPGL